MTEYLHIHSQGAEDYSLDVYDLAEAIAAEAATIASDAGSELLADDTLEERNALRERVIAEAGAALVNVGDTYKDPTGVRWSLIEKE